MTQVPYARTYQTAAEGMSSLSFGEAVDVQFVNKVPKDQRVYKRFAAEEIVGVLSFVVAHNKKNDPKLLPVLNPLRYPMDFNVPT